MSEIIQKVTNDLSFHEGRLVPAGTPILLDTSKVQVVAPDANGEGGNTPNLSDPSVAIVNVAVPVAPIGPTGPNPTMPQQIPPGSLQTNAGYAVPGGALLVAEGSEAARLSAEKGSMAEQFGEEALRHAAETTGDGTVSHLSPRPADDPAQMPLNADERAELEQFRAAKLAAQNDAGNQVNDTFDAASVVEGTVPDVTAKLSGLTADQLDQVEKAEKADKNRAGVLSAIDAQRDDI